MNTLITESLLALGANEVSENREGGSLAGEGDACPGRFVASGAEGACRFALDRISGVIQSIPKDDLVAKRELFVKLLQLGLQFEVFLLELRKLESPVRDGQSEIGEGFDQLDVLDVLGNIVQAFEPVAPLPNVVNDAHNKYSVAVELFRIARDVEHTENLDCDSPVDLHSPSHMRALGEYILLHR